MAACSMTYRYTVVQTPKRDKRHTRQNNHTQLKVTVLCTSARHTYLRTGSTRKHSYLHCYCMQLASGDFCQYPTPPLPETTTRTLTLFDVPPGSTEAEEPKRYQVNNKQPLEMLLDPAHTAKKTAKTNYVVLCMICI